MKRFAWNVEKNEKLRLERNISFEEIIIALEQGNLLDIVEHYNQEKYKGQKIFIININNYAFLVPFIETNEEIFLKTIIPSRKATHQVRRTG